MKKVFTLFVVMLLSLGVSTAGNLKLKDIYFSKLIAYNSAIQILVMYQNINQSFPVASIVYQMKVLERNSGKLVYESSIDGEDLKPNLTKSVNFGVLDYSKLEVGVSYKLTFDTQQEYDEDPSDNTGFYDFDLVDPYYFLSLKLAELFAEDKDLDVNTPAYVHDMAVGQGYEFRSSFGEESFNPQSASFVGWIDLLPNAYYSHPTILYSYDIEKDELNTMDASWYPTLIDSKSNVLSTKDVLVYGEEPEIPVGSSDIFIDNGAGQTKKERVCALLISGTDRDKKRVQDSFINNVELMRLALKNKLSNSGLTDENIRVEHGISGDSLGAILLSMAGKCDKVYFYYSGHMDEMGIMLTGQPGQGIAGASVIELINDIGAKDNCIVWESCYSGLMVDEVTLDNLFTESNVTFISSAAKDKQAFANYQTRKVTGDTIGYGAFTFNFTKCYQDSSADLNNDKMITLNEAYNWLKSNKPKDELGRDIDSLQGFQSVTKERGTIVDKKISFESTDMTISDESGSAIDEDYTVTMSIGSNKFKTTNNKITQVSEGRMWNIESSAENGNFKVDLEVQLNSQYEMLSPMSPNIMGMVWREDGTKDWQPQYPSIYNKDDNTIRCPDVDHFSDWAVGIISANPTSVDSKFLINNVEYGPNPFKNVMNFEFNLDKPESFSIEIVDVTGRRFDFINTQDYEVGTFSVNLDGSKYPSGTYYCRLISDSGIRTIKLVKE